MRARYSWDREVLVGAVKRFRNKRLLVVGDVILDRFIWGAVSRISPEAPVPVVEIERETVCLGGAANVSANIRSLGAMPIPLGVVGGDSEGERLQEGFRALGAPVRGLVVEAERATSVKTRIIAHHQQVCRADREDRGPISPSTQHRLLERFRAALPSSDGVIISDYAKGLVSPSLLREILPAARAAGKVVCAGKKILAATGVPHLLVTRGEEGMALFEGDSRVTHIATVAREVFDVTGAGDTVVSTLALGLASGLTMLEAAVLANFAAGIVVGKLGTASVTPEELVASIHETR